MQPGGAGKTEPDRGNLKPGVIIIWILWIAADIRLHALMPFHNKFHPVTKLLPFINIIQRVPWLRLLTFITWNFIETHANRKCHKSWPVPGSPSHLLAHARLLGLTGTIKLQNDILKVPELLIYRLTLKAAEIKLFQSIPWIKSPDTTKTTNLYHSCLFSLKGDINQPKVI